MTKLQLDDMVGGEENDEATAQQVKKSLLTTLRSKFEAKDTGVEEEEDDIEITGESAGTQVKRARGVKA